MSLDFCDHCQSHNDDCTCVVCQNCNSVDDVDDNLVCADCAKDDQEYIETASNSGRHE